MTSVPTSRAAAFARDVLGVPALPPGPVAAGAARMRSALGRLHAAMAPPPLRILEALFGMLDHRVLVAICDAGVPDVLRKPTDIASLADRLHVDEVMLERLLRYSATRGWVGIDRRGRVRPTRVTAFLRRDHPGGWRAWVDFAGGDEVVSAVQALTTLADIDGFAAVNGASFFAWMADHPERWAIFDEAMGAGGRMHALGLASAVEWDGTGTVCDVGGGTGHLLATLLELVPGLRGVVLDLPDVVARAVRHPRLTAVGGDAFEEVPAGCDTYLLVNVLHDWSDDDAIRLLGRVAEAAPPGARVIVVDNEATTVPRDRLTVSTDVLIAALTSGGRERDIPSFARLGAAAGLRHHRSVRLPSGDLALVFDRT